MEWHGNIKAAYTTFGTFFGKQRIIADAIETEDGRLAYEQEELAVG